MAAVSMLLACDPTINPFHGKQGPDDEGDTQGAEAVDLGLSVKWASFNLGAAKPEEFGDYYAWGELEPYYSSKKPFAWKSGKQGGYCWDSYRWGNAENPLGKYYDDGLDVLKKEDDAASSVLKGSWRMPTEGEWQELLDECEWKQETVNGVEGFRVSGNGKSIFLPAAGSVENKDLYFEGSSGCYWSSSLNKVTPVLAVYFAFDEYSKGLVSIDGSRCRGFSVRAVTK